MAIKRKQSFPVLGLIVGLCVLLIAAAGLRVEMQAAISSEQNSLPRRFTVALVKNGLETGREL
jgi:CTP synthase (UTP-ammonia lyase)